jgi:murein L,D-transpeptidase YcbB/YkuD
MVSHRQLRVLLLAVLIGACANTGATTSRAAATTTSPVRPDDTSEPDPPVLLAGSTAAPAIAPSLQRSADPSVDFDATREAIRALIEGARPGEPLPVGESFVYTGRSLLRFYEARGFAPAFVDEGGRLRRAVVDPLAANVWQTRAHGLRPADYHAEAIRGASETAAQRGPEAVAVLEVLLADAFLTVASHLLNGKVDPEAIFPTWTAQRRRADLLALLVEATDGGRMREALAAVLPSDPGYRRLVDALARYRELEREAVPALEGSWAGTAAQRAALRRQLRARGDLSGDDLADGLRRFQARHGLAGSGTMTEATLAALRVPLGERVQTIRANLDRWRWLPEHLGERQIRVNIPGFELRYIDGGEVRMRMRAIVGKPYRKTPVFSDVIRYLVLNPTWTVPRTIMSQDLLPELRADPRALARRGLQVSNRNGEALTNVRWGQVSPASVVLRQPPGPNNALGPVKFMFPNPHDVYLHGTPRQDLFDEEERAFSSGCIRLERPLDLAAALLPADQGWTRERIDAVVRSRRTQSVSLAEPIPVHLLYATSWVEPDGTVHFRKDVYERDAAVLAALAAERTPEG